MPSGSLGPYRKWMNKVQPSQKARQWYVLVEVSIGADPTNITTEARGKLLEAKDQLNQF